MGAKPRKYVSDVPDLRANTVLHRPIQFEMLHGVNQNVGLLLVRQIGRNIADARVEDFGIEDAHRGG